MNLPLGVDRRPWEDRKGCLDFVALQVGAACVLTDSGGIQEETTVLGVPCLTLRDNTERPITISEGTNRLVGRALGIVLAAYREVRADPPPVRRCCRSGAAQPRPRSKHPVGARRLGRRRQIVGTILARFDWGVGLHPWPA